MQLKALSILSVGQESIAVGVCDALEKDDLISNTYRCHATYIAKGGDLNEMMAELYGKTTGCAGGKAGSMHLVDIKSGIMGASAVVGTTVPVAAGYALAHATRRKKNRPSTCCRRDCLVMVARKKVVFTKPSILLRFAQITYYFYLRK